MTLKDKIKQARARATDALQYAKQPERSYWQGYLTGLTRRQKSRPIVYVLEPFGPVLTAMFDRGVCDGYHIDRSDELRYGPHMRLTVSEFVEHYGEALERNNAAYMRFCCSGFTLRNGHKCKMPEGWRAEKMGSTWVITPDPEAFAAETPA